MRRRFTLAIALLLAAVGLSAGAQTPSSTAQWLESKSANYTVYYQPGYEKDAAFVRTWMDRAEELLKSKYGVPYRGFHVAVYLEPAPTAQADVGLATNQ